VGCALCNPLASRLQFAAHLHGLGLILNFVAIARSETEENLFIIVNMTYACATLVVEARNVSYWKLV
jgi:hypothetical protein